jgi:hypothetical protein
MTNPTLAELRARFVETVTDPREMGAQEKYWRTREYVLTLERQIEDWAKRLNFLGQTTLAAEMQRAVSGGE